MVALIKTRPYRRLLTSIFHRRFVHASAVALLASYAVSFLIGTKNSFFWSWFPLGICGFRAVLLSVSSLVIFVLRVGGMHIGSRSTSTPFQSFKQTAFSFATAQTFAWYLFSAWWFSEIYIWSASEDAELNWVVPGKSFERSQLNERPIYLQSYYFLLAIGQSLLHIYYDWDQVPIPVVKLDRKTTDRRTHPLEPLTDRIKKTLPQIAYQSLIRSVLTTMVGPFVYQILLRRTAWNWTLFFAKLFWDFPRSAAEPPGILPPLHIMLMFRATISGTFLVILWQTSNLLFSTFLGQEPLKKQQPLTISAKDPNGSLLNGLKANKEIVQTYALWELYLISQQFTDRRKEIFNDIDREGGSAWTQILKTLSEVIRGIPTRIEGYKNPQPTPASEKSQQVPPALNEKAEIDHLPRLSPAPKQENIFAASPKPVSRSGKLEASFRTAAKTYGQSHQAPSLRDRPQDSLDQRQILPEFAQDPKRLTEGGTTSSRSHETGPPFPEIERFFKSPLGIPFRQTYSRRLRLIILGSPHSSLAPIVDATESLTRLLVASLTEDKFGKVQGDVATVFQLFTETILAIEAFVSEDGLPVHWTDVEFPSRDAGAETRNAARKVEEVEIILTTMKAGLAELLDAFQPYLNEVGVTGKDLRLAREAAEGVS